MRTSSYTISIAARHFLGWRARGLVALLVALQLTDVAVADDQWSFPYPGVTHLHRRAGRKEYHALIIDLGLAEISVITTHRQDRGINVRDFARRYDADIAINANFFDIRMRSCGLAASDGKVWSDSYEEGCDMSLGFGALNQAMAFNSADYLRGPLPFDWMRHVVSGKPWLVRQGVVQTNWRGPSHLYGYHPRTAAGINQEGSKLIILVADGRRPGIPGMMGSELGRIMARLGAYYAVNLDGGGSSSLFVGAEGGVQNRPSDGRIRSVSSHLGIRVRRTASWYGAKLIRQSEAPKKLAPGQSAYLWVRYRNAGRVPWELEGSRAVNLVTAGSRPSWFVDRGWVSSTTPVFVSQRTEPGAEALFQFRVTAPVLPGSYRLRLLPQTVSGGHVTAEVAEWVMVVEDPSPHLPQDGASDLLNVRGPG